MYYNHTTTNNKTNLENQVFITIKSEIMDGF